MTAAELRELEAKAGLNQHEGLLSYQVSGDEARLYAYLRNHCQDFIKLMETAERHCVKRMLDDDHELRQALAAFKEKS